MSQEVNRSFYNTFDQKFKSASKNPEPCFNRVYINDLDVRSYNRNDLAYKGVVDFFSTVSDKGHYKARTDRSKVLIVILFEYF